MGAIQSRKLPDSVNIESVEIRDFQATFFRPHGATKNIVSYFKSYIGSPLLEYISVSTVCGPSSIATSRETRQCRVSGIEDNRPGRGLFNF